MKKRFPYYIATGLLTLMVLATIANSIFNPEFVHRFSEMGYPTYLIFPLMTAKAMGVLALWFGRDLRIREWAYSGFFFLFVLAFFAELHAVEPDYFSPPLALSLLLGSYYFRKHQVGKTIPA